MASSNQRSGPGVRKALVAIGVVLLIVAMGYGAYYNTRQAHSRQQDAVSTQSKPSVFSFSGADGWRQGPSNETSMALFGSERTDGTSACFVSIEYTPGKIRPAEQLQTQIATLQKDGISVAELSVVPMTLQTKAGAVDYELHQLALTGSEGAAIQGGLALGYVQLNDHYAKADAHCDTADQLGSTLPALRAYRLNR